MNGHTEVQIINQGGRPAFAVVPYSDWLKLTGQESEALVPHAVVDLVFVKGLSPLAAWRKYKNISQADIAGAMGITQAAVAQIEKADSKPQQKTIERYTAALGITEAQLDI